ncbi:GtrA family protein [Schaalia sp. 19OD2882]|uniref:GtrA family protein n=1 Tax=Schaalia sp. 19OD2882 TaxID=2794089 RepID=UPI001C1EF677|nr:GtrA family protein [Schaalia sp. 19OD2882]QWW20292.1 GtrA family protein [Schaalia sp. 19OD2882]
MTNAFLHGSSVWRYLFVGVGTSLLDLALFTVGAVLVGIHPVPANVISTVITVCVSYFVNQSFVFGAARRSWGDFFSFAGLTLFTGTVLQSGVIWVVIGAADLFLPGLGRQVVSPAAKVLSMGVGALCNYLGYRWVFRAR